MSETSSPSIAGNVKRALVWSTINSLALRLCTLVLGMVLARLLTPDEFGIYAIALTVQSILMTLADLGMTVVLIRADDPKRHAPTVATLSFVSGLILALTMTATAGPVASAMGNADALEVVAVLSWTLVIGGAGVVPYAKLQREFQQSKLFLSAVVDFIVSTSVTLTLIAFGSGPIALAIGRVAAQLAATSLQFVLAHERPRFGFDREIARGALTLGMPLAAANLLSWALLNLDNIAISRIAGTTALGFYVLAFNISSWPMTAIGQAIRSVSLPGFSRISDADGEASLVRALSLAWAVALPVGALLAALSYPLVTLLYGVTWEQSAPVLAALGMFGALRVVFDLFASYLMAKGAARAVLSVQVVWFLTLIPAVVLGTRWGGIAGAGWSHLVVGVAVILPAYAYALHHSNVSYRGLLSALWPPMLATAPAWWLAHVVAERFSTAYVGLLAGGTVGVLVYAALAYRWVRPLLPERTRAADPGVLPTQVEQPQLSGAG